MLVIEELGPNGEDLMPWYLFVGNIDGHLLGPKEAWDLSVVGAISRNLLDSDGERELPHLGKEKDVF